MLRRIVSPNASHALVPSLAALSLFAVATLAGCGVSADGSEPTDVGTSEGALSECLFGTSLEVLDVDANGLGLKFGETVVVTAHSEFTSAAGLDAVTRRQVVLAVKASSHKDVRTAEEAIDRVDENLVDRYELRDDEGHRAFTAFLYGAGDNTYGAIFTAGTAQKVAEIHDGDFESCTVSPKAKKGATYRKLTLTKAIKALRADCLEVEKRADDAFYCPTVDRYSFSGPVDGVAWTRLLTNRSVDEADVHEVTIDEAVRTLRSRTPGAIVAGESAIDTDIRRTMDAYEAFLRNAPGTRILIGSGYWAPSVNSDTVFVVDDVHHTVLAVEHGDTDG
ncbi:MAG: hypothetical protein U0169_05270 [Polyangiaceae bacterium]